MSICLYTVAIKDIPLGIASAFFLLASSLTTVSYQISDFQSKVKEEKSNQNDSED
jgi:hypothetical protein